MYLTENAVLFIYQQKMKNVEEQFCSAKSSSSSAKFGAAALHNCEKCYMRFDTNFQELIRYILLDPNFAEELQLLRSRPALNIFQLKKKKLIKLKMYLMKSPLEINK